MLILVNHKANLKYNEVIEYEKKIRDLNIIIFPTLSYLPVFQKGNYTLGAQDISEFIEKEKTGEINGEQLKSLNVKYVLVGHRDRRIYKKEKLNTLISKVKNCIKYNITPIYFIGTNYENDLYEINEILKVIENNEILLIYEPYENIGNKKPELRQIDTYITNIKELIKSNFKKNIKILYGGGVNTDNISLLKDNKNIDGIILSNSSLNIMELKQIYLKINKI